ncbi:MAG: hypothetical protein ACYTAS_11875 [Planctomycetota bacterium]|jgi:hypothetical protein
MRKQLRTVRVKVLWILAALIWAWLIGFWCGASNQRRRDVDLIRYAAEMLRSQPMGVVADFVEGNGNREGENDEPNETP